MLDGIIKSIRDGLDKNNVYQPCASQVDPCIVNLEQTINNYTIEIDRWTTEIREESSKIVQIKKRYGQAAKNSPAENAYKKDALPHLRRIELLKKSIDEATQKKANFVTLSENMKKQKRMKEEESLLKEASVRMGINQSEMDTTALKGTITDVRRLNQGIEKNGSILCAPISTENYNDHDDELLAQLDNFEELNITDDVEENANYYPITTTGLTITTIPINQQQTRRNNNNTVMNNM